MRENLRALLLGLQAEDARVRAALAASGELYAGYAPAMAAVHDRHAAVLEDLVGRHGWPGRRLAGEDGAQAAWLVLQHAISHPALLRRCLPLLQEAAAQGDIPAWQPAILEDRIRVFEGRPQRFGTQFDWDAKGEFRPLPIEDPAGVDERRRTLGLKGLAERHDELRRDAGPPPADPARRLAEAEAWARAQGWRQ